MRPENVTGPASVHAEAPLWWPGWGGLRWVDGDAGDLLTLRADGIHRLHLDDEYAAFIRPRARGGFVALGARTLYLSDSVDGPADAVQTFDLGDARFNDGTVDPLGRLLAGSMTTGSSGRVLRVDAAFESHLVIKDVDVSNGIGFSADGARAYYVDTLTHRIDEFDVIDGELTTRRPFAMIPEEQGLPDGLTVAADDSVWVALWGGHAVNGYDSDGILRERISLPVSQISACTFGDDDLGTLYITTSAQGMGTDHGTDAGSVYATRFGVQGLPTIPFAG